MIPLSWVPSLLYLLLFPNVSLLYCHPFTLQPPFLFASLNILLLFSLLLFCLTLLLAPPLNLASSQYWTQPSLTPPPSFPPTNVSVYLSDTLLFIFPPPPLAGEHGVWMQLVRRCCWDAGVVPAGWLLPSCQGMQLGAGLHRESSQSGWTGSKGPQKNALCFVSVADGIQVF